jgi:hypothetical protein
MKHIVAAALLVLLLTVGCVRPAPKAEQTDNTQSAPAQVNQPSGTSSGGKVQVKGYTKKDGTYVAPHERSAPKAGKGK